MNDSSWENVSTWYDKVVGKEGHYYHQHIVIPGTLRLLDFKHSTSPSVLDLGCGQGVLARHLPKTVPYVGVDTSKSLLASAKKEARTHWSFFLSDLQKPLELEKKDFTHACILLALQNMKDPFIPIQNAADHLVKGGTLLIVLNHPCFRIPRQSSWQIDEKKMSQYRRIDRYMTPLSIPIQMHPGNQPAEKTFSYHFPLSTYIDGLRRAGFCLHTLEEWCSDKQSSGKKAKMENRARTEFPLFMALLSKKR